MKVVKALLVWLISIPLYTIAWLLSVFSFVFVMPIKEYNKVLYGVKTPKIKVKSVTEEELLKMLKNDISNKKKDNDKNINDKDKVS